MSVTQETDRIENELHSCNDCGNSGGCGRLIDSRDGSIWPQEDTGFRFKRSQ